VVRRALSFEWVVLRKGKRGPLTDWEGRADLQELDPRCQEVQLGAGFHPESSEVRQASEKPILLLWNEKLNTNKMTESLVSIRRVSGRH